MSSDPVKIQLSKMNNRKKVKQTLPADTSKLKTSVLNQLNPNLTAEQKLSRKLNDVEKWLLEHESKTHVCKIFNEGETRPRENKNLLNPVIVDKLTAHQSFNKDPQTMKKLKRSGYQSKHQKEILNSTKNLKMFEDIKISEEFSECENLLASEDDQVAMDILTDKQVDEKPEAVTASSDASHVRNVIVHHIHHFYHFDEKE